MSKGQGYGRIFDWENMEAVKIPDFDALSDLHVQFERIHPFQDGDGRIGRLILFKECLNHNMVPFIITDDLKMFYYRGVSEWNDEKSYLRDTCLTGQNEMIKYLDYFRIEYAI